MSIKYISDYHFGHKNILRYDNRPWIDVNEMNDALIERFKNSVSKDDTVYILGDVVWSDKYDNWVEVFTKLKSICQNIFIVIRQQLNLQKIMS